MSHEKSNVLHDQQQELRGRLKALATRFGQAEIARRTGAAPANVHRYLREGKVPAEFCAALVALFGVSPIWMLAGEGNMLRSDVRKPVAQMGGDLLELVETMNAVSKLRLGSIAARADARQLRELSDAMQTMDRLRERLNRQTLPVINSVLGDFEAAIAELDMDSAAGIRTTAANLVRLSLDEDVLARFEQNEAGFLYMSGQIDRALDLDLRIFARRLHRGGIADESGLADAVNLVMGLREAGRLRDARRIAGAALALATDRCEGMRQFLLLRLFEAHLELDLGLGVSAIKKHFEAYPAMEPKDPTCWVLHATMLIVTGNATWEDIIGTPWAYSGLARLLVRYAYLHEDEPRLARAMRELVGKTTDRQPEHEYEAVYARGMLDLLRGRKSTATEFDRLADSNPPMLRSAPLRQLLLSLHRAAWARLGQDRAGLRQECLRTQQLLVNLPPELSAKPEYFATHLRNLRGAHKPTPDHDQARALTQEKLQSLVNGGLRVFAPWLHPPTTRTAR
ncbi:MAG: hypothetical protein IPP14_03415 [Planctomycetes bacterium]|nr:hypothetical protein [Planctomycetota bacterium]